MSSITDKINRARESQQHYLNTLAQEAVKVPVQLNLDLRLRKEDVKDTHHP